MRRRVLIAALGMSVLAHAALLGSLAVFAPAIASSPPPFDATLAVVAPPPAPRAPQAEPVPPPAKPTPKPTRQASPGPGVEAPLAKVVAHAAPSPAALPTAVGGAAGSAPSPVRAPAEIIQAASQAAPVAADAPQFDVAGWPHRGHIRFRVLLGERGFEVGEARHEWSHDGGRYRMTVTVETTGVVDLFSNLRYRQHSEGLVDDKGLQPERFGVEQSGRKPQTATFDWTAGQVTMQRGERVRSAPIRRGDQDVLSLWHQIGVVGAGGLPRELTVVSGKSAKPSVLEDVGSEALSLPIGRIDARRVRARALDGKLSIDIWLARDYDMLPVRIRIVDDKGEMLDQQAVELRLTPPGERSGADAPRQLAAAHDATCAGALAAPPADGVGFIEPRDEQAPVFHLPVRSESRCPDTKRPLRAAC